jgi:hypothetical protein
MTTETNVGGWFSLRSISTSSGGRFPAESGWLTRSAKLLLDERGQAWRGHGLTCFMLYARYLRGDDIQPMLEYARTVGVNYLRVFGPVQVPPWDVEWQFYSQPDPALFARLGEFLDVLGTSSLRCEFVPLCGNYPESAARQLVEATYHHAAWNLMVEWTNEPGQPATYCGNLHAFDSIPRANVPSATGIAWILDASSAPLLTGSTAITGFDQLHWLDYGTPHLNDTSYAGSPHARYPRQSKGLKEWRDGDPEIAYRGSNCAEWNDEAARVDDTDSYPGLEDHVANTAIACLFGGASLIHYNAGKIGVPPTPGGLEDRVIREALSVWQFIPASAQTGGYTRGDFADFPVYWTPSDSTISHAYGVWCGSVGWCVNPLPAPGWVATPKPWVTSLEAGPRPWILKATR